MPAEITQRTLDDAYEEFLALRKIFPDQTHPQLGNLSLAASAYFKRNVPFDDAELTRCLDNVTRLLRIMLLEITGIPVDDGGYIEDKDLQAA